MQRVATIAAIVEQHAGDAAFLWVRRGAEVRGRRFGETDLGRLDQRLTAHLAGLVAAGEAGWSAALAQFADWPEAGEVFVLGALALHHGEPALVSRALDAGAQVVEAGRSGLSGAVARTPPERLRPFVVDWLASADPALRWLGTTALSHHRADGRRRLEALIEDPDRSVHTRALRLVGELGRRDLTPVLGAALGEADEAARYQAACSACLVGARDLAAPALDRLAEEGGAFAADAAAVRLATAPAEEARAWLRRWTSREPVTLVDQLGVPRDRAIVPWLIVRMRVPGTAFEAGAAFRDLFAIDFDATDLFTEVPESLGPAFADVETVPLPIADRIEAWWDDGRGTWPLEDRPSLRQLSMRALRAAAAEPGHPLANWRRTRDFPAWS
jgi:uncharacterized protein (TIGR02270 family)